LVPTDLYSADLISSGGLTKVLHASTSAAVKGFGRRPIAALPLALGPSSESLQRRNPRVRTGRCSALWGFEVWDGAAGDGWWGIAAGVEADVGVIGSAADAFLGCGRRGMQGLGAVGSSTGVAGE
jgi:hypothetical protein